MTALPLFNGTRPYEIIPYVDAVTGGLFGYGILLLIFFVMYVSLSAHPPTKAIAGSSFTTALLAWLFFWMGVGESWFPILLSAVAAVTILASFGETVYE